MEHEWELVGTRERESVVGRLMYHQGRGRLSAQDYLDRVELARAAVTEDDLLPLLADLEPEADPPWW